MNSPRLADFEGRKPVLFRSHDGTPVGTVDVSRLLRSFPLLQHQLHQRADRTLTLRVRLLHGADATPEALRASMEALFGALPLAVSVDKTLGDEGKSITWSSEVS